MPWPLRAAGRDHPGVLRSCCRHQCPATLPLHAPPMPAYPETQIGELPLHFWVFWGAPARPPALLTPAHPSCGCRPCSSSREAAGPSACSRAGLPGSSSSSPPGFPGSKPPATIPKTTGPPGGCAVPSNAFYSRTPCTAVSAPAGLSLAVSPPKMARAALTCLRAAPAAACPGAVPAPHTSACVPCMSSHQTHEKQHL